jgi:hypothetical protein
MRTDKLLVMAAVTFSNISLTAQQASTTMQQSATAGSRINESGSANTAAHANPGAQANGAAGSSATAGSLGAGKSSTSGAASASEDMRPVSGELQGKLDSKTAKPGDPVVLKTSDKAKAADGTVIPKGSRLVGHVTDVQSHDSGHADSQMGIVFDRAELKNGQTMVIHSVIQSVGPRTSAIAAGSMDSDDSFGAPMSGGGGGRAMGSGRAGGGLVGGGGGLVGGAAGSTVGRTSYATEQAGAGVASTTSGAVRSTGRVAGDTAAGVGSGAHAVAGSSGSLATHATGFPGVMLAGSASNASSGTFSASKKNIHFDSGTEMQLGIAAAGKQ